MFDIVDLKNGKIKTSGGCHYDKKEIDVDLIATMKHYSDEQDILNLFAEETLNAINIYFLDVKTFDDIKIAEVLRFVNDILEPDLQVKTIDELHLKKYLDDQTLEFDFKSENAEKVLDN